MAVATKVGEGQMIDHAHTAAVAAGEILKVGELVLIASRKAEANENIGWHTCGLFDFPKLVGAMTKGAKLYWDDAGKVATLTVGSNRGIGFVQTAVGAGAGELIVRVLFGQFMP